jgi:hypothetical protein
VQNWHYSFNLGSSSVSIYVHVSVTHDFASLGGREIMQKRCCGILCWVSATVTASLESSILRPFLAEGSCGPTRSPPCVCFLHLYF